jgi:hypothetical protein
MRSMWAMCLALAGLPAAAAEVSQFDSIGKIGVNGPMGTRAGEVYVWAAGGAWSAGNPAFCDTSQPYTFDATSTEGSLMHTFLLAAWAGKRQISPYIEGCLNGKPRIVRIDMR